MGSGHHALWKEFHGNNTNLMGSGHLVSWKEFHGNNTSLELIELSSDTSESWNLLN